MTNDDERVEIADEFDSETRTVRGTGMATAHTAGMAARLMTSGMSAREAVEAMRAQQDRDGER